MSSLEENQEPEPDCFGSVGRSGFRGHCSIRAAGLWTPAYDVWVTRHTDGHRVHFTAQRSSGGSPQTLKS